MNSVKKVSLLDACVINMGQSPDSSMYNQEGEGLPFFQGKADFGDLHPSARYYCSEPKKVANKGDLLLSVRAPIGALNIATEECCIGRGLAALSAKQTTDMKYLYYALFSMNDELNARGTGSTFKAINKQDLAVVEIPLPSREEQRRISTTLDAVSEVLRLRKAQLAELDNLVKSQFVEMFGDPQTNPHGYKLAKLGDVCDLKAGKFIGASDIQAEYSDGLYPCFGGNGLRGYVTDYSHDGEFPLIGRQGALCGNVKYAVGKFRATEHAVVVRPQIDMDTYWLYFLLMGLQLNRLAAGAAQPGLTVSKLEQIEITIPYIKLQERFSAFAMQADKSKFAIQQSLDETQRLFDSLMAEYFD